MKTIVLTGATGGLGLEVAKEIIGKKCGRLIAVYRDEDKYNRLFSEYHDVQPYKTSNSDDYKSIEGIIVQSPVEEIVLVLNAFSIVPIKRIGDYSYAEIDEMVQGNIRQNIILINEIVRICRTNSYKLRIINLDSGAANFPLMGWGNYCASKAYMNAFLAVVALENEDYKVVSFDPGVMDTKMQMQIRETDKSIFDQVDKFISYKENNQLFAPSFVAKQLVERYISDWKAEVAREKCRA